MGYFLLLIYTFWTYVKIVRFSFQFIIFPSTPCTCFSYIFTGRSIIGNPQSMFSIVHYLPYLRPWSVKLRMPHVHVGTHNTPCYIPSIVLFILYFSVRESLTLVASLIWLLSALCVFFICDLSESLDQKMAPQLLLFYECFSDVESVALWKKTIHHITCVFSKVVQNENRLLHTLQ